MAITHATSTGPIGETQWNENHAVDAAALRAALNVEDGATANATDAALRDRATHTGSQAIATVTGLQDALDGKLVDADIDTLAKINAIVTDATLLASSAFAAVATTGAYSDLSGKPTIIDWTTDQGATNLHAGNIPDLSETYEPADATILKSAAIGTTVQGYDADTAKLDVAQSWTATQSFTTITGTAVTVSSPGTAQSVALDGRCHVIELADGINTEITGVPGSGFSNCLVRIKQPAVGSGTISWAAGHRFMGGSELNTASDSFSDFMLDSHDGSTVLYRGVGVEP